MSDDSILTKTKSIRVNPVLWQAARVHALKQGLTASELVNKLLSAELANELEILRIVSTTCTDKGGSK